MVWLPEFAHTKYYAQDSPICTMRWSDKLLQCCY